jgi:hypothetical protein
VTAHLEYLGHCFTVGPAGRTLHRVYVVWLPLPPSQMVRGLLRLAAAHWACPECGARWPLERPGGAILTAGPHDAMRKISDSCGPCQTIVHWDCSTADERAALRWPTMYERDEAIDGPRFARFPRPEAGV